VAPYRVVVEFHAYLPPLSAYQLFSRTTGTRLDVRKARGNILGILDFLIVRSNKIARSVCVCVCVCVLI
jgi:hypothetical protein